MSLCIGWDNSGCLLQAIAEGLCVEVEAANAEASEGPDPSRSGYHSSGGCGEVLDLSRS